MSSHIFQDRKQAGQLLGQCLRILPADDMKNSLIVALPRGGVPVGYEIAKVLNAPLETLIVRKIEHPRHDGMAIGAIVENGICSLYEEDGFGTDISGEIIQEMIRKEKNEITRLAEKYRDGKAHTSLRGKTIILVDDGLESGISARAAAQYCRSKGARLVILAVPVCSQKTIAKLQKDVDVLLCLTSPHYFSAVGYSYKDYHAISDDEVIEILDRSHCNLGFRAQNSEDPLDQRVPG